MHTSRGPFILEVFDHLDKSSEHLRSLIAEEIFSKLESCLPVEGEPLTSNGADKMWSTFHKLRLSEEMFKKWSAFIQRSSRPEPEPLLASKNTVGRVCRS